MPEIMPDCISIEKMLLEYRNQRGKPLASLRVNTGDLANFLANELRAWHDLADGKITVEASPCMEDGKVIEDETPDSFRWATEFLDTHDRFPTAIDYAEAGFTGGQCDCSCCGLCPLRNHKLVTETTDRNCYANQLRDFIDMLSET